MIRAAGMTAVVVSTAKTGNFGKNRRIIRKRGVAAGEFDGKIVVQRDRENHKYPIFNELRHLGRVSWVNQDGGD